MNSNIGLIKKSPEQSPSRYNSSFFSAKSALPLIDSRLALAHKIGQFIEEAIDTCYFKYWLNDVLDTPFCSDTTQQSRMYVAPFILRMIELMDQEYAIDNILICMLIYIDRYFNLHKKDYLHQSNFKLLLICSAWLAIKVLEDTPINPLAFSQWVVLSGINKDQAQALEVFFLTELDWQAHITEPIYKNFCHALDAYQPELDLKTIDENNDDVEDELRGLAFV